MEHIINLTKENIQQIVDASMDNFVVMSFWAQQQPQSVQMLQVMEQIANEQAGRFILAKVNCEAELEIANYFQIQSLPTHLVLSKGQPVDGFAGVQSAAQVNELLDKHLPALWVTDFNAAKAILVEAGIEKPSDEKLEQALALLKSAFAESQQQAEVALVLIDVYLQLGILAEAKTLLDTIGLADQDSYYQNLKAKLALAEDAADTPEIRQLQQSLQQQPGNIELTIDLAKALNQANRGEEALECLFAILEKDLSAADGKVKQVFMEILTALGQGNAIASQYRRRLYSLLY
ncbi:MULTISPECIES: tetratricopeptide repeat protein [unclassified Shewanella]|uniref:co-chaperone YbbN n=1 Tax=unclassified Shewanella TaxID=196818 RepID=UPI000C83C5B6|nr:MULTISPECIES: tetratricopeptide repeat protein [unclassified Shewanella]MDO6621075.1 tetratricopeptide repeat protein [Shewanella sp. 6_MG-2023]MDO6639381.1 tetratricopeptide repeat protein [Shewanella sp. 5_MG-2023]MDO6678145.1 tetratricopeptide repeat protein [Shewanella sp. 4_MG-2023]MDO6777326.1 tetratricopeptide repeat protein [Shewanella sp. 3_MG-2023]PMG30328.1 co-chaperone YbbN [Shewanella sp. 10N.286.52.C2]